MTGAQADRLIFLVLGCVMHLAAIFIALIILIGKQH